MRSGRRTNISILTAIGLLGTGSCGRAPDHTTYSSPAGRIDSAKAAAAADPGFVMNYDEPAATTAGELLAEYAKTFSARRFSLGEPDRYEFLGSPHAAENPGLCKVQTLTIQLRSSSDGKHPEWMVNSSERYAVIGSLAPLTPSWTDAYGRRLEQACSVRRDFQHWFTAPHESDAAHAAAIMDVLITAARSKADLPFALRCVPAGQNDEKPACADVRATLGGLDPRAIDAVQARPCPDETGPGFCGTIALARERSSIPSSRSDEWVLSVAVGFDENGLGNPEIGSVEIKHVQRVY